MILQGTRNGGRGHVEFTGDIVNRYFSLWFHGSDKMGAKANIRVPKVIVHYGSRNITGKSQEPAIRIKILRNRLCKYNNSTTLILHFDVFYKSYW
jgi:hypothetical protein